MRLYVVHKFFLPILFILLTCIGCSTNDSSRTEMDYPRGRTSSKSVFWDKGSIKEHLYYADYRPKGLKHLYFKTKREPLPKETQKLFIENLRNQVTIEITNGNTERDLRDRFFSYESIYECVTTFDDWGIGVSRRRCSKCLHNTILIYYISPEITWKSLAGRAGFMLICPHCLTQHEFHCNVLS
jgi:hypothetical protein